MTRNVALRASAFFALLTLVFGAIGASAGTGLAGLLVLIGLALGSLTALFALATPARVPVPVRVRR